jgi:Phage protein Gp9.
MRVPPLPKKWLIHTVVYRGYTGQNDGWGNPVYEDPITIENVRVDNSTVFSRDSTQTKIQADAVIFVDTVHSKPLPAEFKEQSVIEFNGKEFVLQKVVPCYFPDRNEIHHWELEVI